ncbi:O-antigen ligase-like membrane protein [Gillisia mitskevichiae]|uniref:O-antigen ligase-like membrane protein n=1 Tax=Gillisia mitskevichiae TaxID=270921 RepID=A0A495P5Q1_9FLAO|nr:O-antigen ligase family protein [Gillisia mitskevichiae]RKS45160.1 O-antigen ligase-like membrane protein [Gillisia mitskevichiae]
MINQPKSFSYIEILLLHIVMAVAIYLYRPMSGMILFGVLLYFTFIIIQNENRNNEALMAAAYIAGAEVFFRMTDGMVFYETGKYSVIIFMVIGMFFKGTSSKTVPFWTYLLFLIPGIIVASFAGTYEIEFRKLIAFNLSGPVTIGVSALYCYYKKIKRKDFERVVVMLLMPLLAQMFYLYLYTPSLKEGIISLSGNYAATGGYGPNQISTVLGMGAFLLVTRLFVIKNRLVNILDFILLGMMGYRAVITFSRGGVITAIICMIAFIIIFYYKQNSREVGRMNSKIFMLFAALILIWFYSSFKTFGLIENRYKSENAAGELKSDITTGRVELIETELHAFYYNPLLGIGVGMGREYREKNLGIEINTHNEISRLLSEHGMFGVIALLILIFVPIVFWTKFKNNYYFLAFMAFWFLTINHSAMRIALPAFVYGLALLYIVDEKKPPVHRKRLSY